MLCLFVEVKYYRNQCSISISGIKIQTSIPNLIDTIIDTIDTTIFTESSYS